MQKVIWSLIVAKYYVGRVLSQLPGVAQRWPYITPQSTIAYREVLYNEYLGSLPQLYIYSTKDVVCSAKYISDYISRRRKQGLSPDIIDTLLVDDAPHVGIFKLHPKEYVEKLDAFLARVQKAPRAKL